MEALEAYRYEVQKDGFQLDLKTAPDIPDSFADPNAITMAFLNMLDNSVKYSGGQKQIEVRVGRTNGFVDLSVTDKGIGIPLKCTRNNKTLSTATEPLWNKVKSRH